jgi:hypothetical protein
MTESTAAADPELLADQVSQLDRTGGVSSGD